MAAVLSIASDQLWPPGCDLSKRGYQAIQHFAHSLPFISYIPPDLRTHLLESNSLDMMVRETLKYFNSRKPQIIFKQNLQLRFCGRFSVTRLNENPSYFRLVRK